MPQKQKSYILLTVDVEDWFQVENFKPWIPYSTWDSRELRVEKNTHRILDLFDSINGLQVNATFFVLGWIAERLPDLVREIYNRGHEVASHGYIHNLCSQETRAQLKQDLTESKKLLEDILSTQVHGYRAPNFSISNDTLKLIEDCGYLYDSSYNSFDMNERYGHLYLSQIKKKGIVSKVSESFFEIPISNLSLNGIKQTIPWGGGGYFRLFPFFIFKKGIHSILQKDKAYLFYMHPWEIDSGQPRVKDASAFFKFRHYVNLKRTEERLKNLITAFHQNEFSTCRELIQSLEGRTN